MSDIDDTVTADVFGLDGSFPCPGWRVLDAARSRRFTGEVTCATIPVTKVYFDAGQIYFAERVSDPSLGARLVDAGALDRRPTRARARCSSAGIAHLGRLFERVGSVDRQQVLLVAELMTEERVGWLAGRLVAGVALAPYRHHPTGVRRWAWPTEPLRPGRCCTRCRHPRPAPHADRVGGSPNPGLRNARRRRLTSSLRPSRSTVGRPAGTNRRGSIRGPAASPLVPPAAPLVPPTAGVAPLPAPAGAPGAAATTPPNPVADADADRSTPAGGHDPVGRFELIWPSGEVDDQVGLAAHIDTDPTPEAGLSMSLLSVLHDVATSSIDSTIEQPGRTPLADMNASIDAAGDSSDAVALAVRRAVATIETGSLDARRRFVAAPPDGDRSPGDDPGDMMSAPIASSLRRASLRSVFDDAHDDAHTVEDTIPEAPQVEAVEPDSPDGDERAGALRRLIDSMRRG